MRASEGDYEDLDSNPAGDDVAVSMGVSMGAALSASNVSLAPVTESLSAPIVVTPKTITRKVVTKLAPVSHRPKGNRHQRVVLGNFGLHKLHLLANYVTFELEYEEEDFYEEE